MSSSSLHTIRYRMLSNKDTPVTQEDVSIEERGEFATALTVRRFFDRNR